MRDSIQKAIPNTLKKLLWKNESSEFFPSEGHKKKHPSHRAIGCKGDKRWDSISHLKSCRKERLLLQEAEGEPRL